MEKNRFSLLRPLLEMILEKDPIIPFDGEDTLEELNLRLQIAKTLTRIAPHKKDIQALLAQGAISETEAIDLYTALSIFLCLEENHKRLVLYLPFEIIPEQSWTPKSTRLQTAVLRFKEVYLNMWKKLLTVRDVAANFSDGDFPEEVPIASAPRVIKAAHLIPYLLQKGVLEPKHVEQLSAEGDDLLRESIKEGILLYTKSFTKNPLRNFPERRVLTLDQIVFQTKNIPSPSLNYENGGRKSAARIHWEKQKQHEDLVFDYATDLFVSLKQNKTTQGELLKLMHSKQTPFLVCIAMTALKLFCVHANLSPYKKKALAKRLVQKVRKTFNVFQGSEVTDCFEVTVQQLANTGLLPEKISKQCRLFPEKLWHSFSETTLYQSPQHRSLILFVESLQTNTVLKKRVFPTVVLFGSRIKGYAARYADDDVAIFVKPEVSFSERSRLRKAVARCARQSGLSIVPLEFWVGESNYGYFVRDFIPSDSHVAESHFIHVLFHGVFLGSGCVSKKLITGLIPAYFYDVPERIVWQEQLERDIILYRLLHKGFSRFYPVLPGQTFWDSTFRFLASNLFVKSFLPKR